MDFDRIIKRIGKWKNNFRIFKLRLGGVKIHSTVKVDLNVAMNLISPFFGSLKGSIEIGENSFISNGVICDAYSGRIKVGSRVFIGPNVTIYGHGDVTIGNDSLIAMGCKIISANHAVPDIYTLIRTCPDIKKEIIIGNDVWLGADVKVLAGVSIGNGCVVGAGSVVTKNLEPYAIAVGVPARIIGNRNMPQE
jgi:acetyltransferase-like isoleucine patch superfamily enzyme